MKVLINSTPLRQLASTCQFTDIDNEIRTQIIQRCLSTKLREAALRDDAITLTKLLAHGRAIKQASDMEKSLTAPTQDFAALAIRDDESNQRLPDESRNNNALPNRSRPSGNRQPTHTQQHVQRNNNDHRIVRQIR